MEPPNPRNQSKYDQFSTLKASLFYLSCSSRR
ncbi:hypothetical protein CCACVL1_28522 [Corchorus capsularis]|uniref:Uncharacterized protein n=1 Tax=Corchorus capsularis TaxID=210143 RepID=A0A1R3G681_COCAP|nr:hypothetical protein CCACVL1_28522 [Corchorus capsularis]